MLHQNTLLVRTEVLLQVRCCQNIWKCFDSIKTHLLEWTDNVILAFNTTFFFSFSCLFHWKRISWTEAKCNRTSVCKLVQSFSKHWKNRSYKLILTDVFYSYLLSYVFFPQRGEKNALSCAIEKAISESIEKFVAALV